MLQVLDSYEEIWHVVQHTSTLPCGNLSENKGSFLIKQCFLFFKKGQISVENLKKANKNPTFVFLLDRKMKSCTHLPS